MHTPLNSKMSLENLSLVEAARMIRSGALSPVDYAVSLLARIDALEPRVRAWASMDRETVLQEAAACAAEAAKKQFRGPLHGAPVGVKDIFYTRNLRTTMGSTLFEDFVPSYDARAVVKLKEAGAIVLGKTVTTVFAFLDPGPTRNPWNLNHTPGGSSSGSAAAVAARMCPAAIGSQTVGSIGRPAGFNGLVSLVPTQERISRRGAFPLAWPLDHVGVLARSVADAELMTDVMAESPIPKRQERRPFRIGVIRGFFYENASPEARLLGDAFADKLANNGFQVEEAAPPSVFELAQPILRTILRADVAAVHEKLFAEHPSAYGPKLRELIETGMLLKATDYLRACRLRRQYQKEMAALFRQFDVLMTPAARGTAPEGISSTGDAVMNAPWSLADFPTMTIPYALAANGLPLGVQLTAAPLQEDLLLAAARRIETVAEFAAAPRL